MKVTVYVNWDEQKVYSESEYEIEIIHRVEEFCEDNDNFAEWLKANYSVIEMFNLEGKQKEEARQAFWEYAQCQEKNVGFGWYCEKFTFEI